MSICSTIFGVPLGLGLTCMSRGQKIFHDALYSHGFACMACTYLRLSRVRRGDSKICRHRSAQRVRVTLVWVALVSCFWAAERTTDGMICQSFYWNLPTLYHSAHPSAAIECSVFYLSQQVYLSDEALLCTKWGNSFRLVSQVRVLHHYIALFDYNSRFGSRNRVSSYFQVQNSTPDANS